MEWKKVKVDDELTQGFIWFCFFEKLQYCNWFLSDNDILFKEGVWGL